MSAAPLPTDGVSIRVRGLRKTLGGQEVLKGIDFEVRRGELFVIMGPSGCGKTVLLKHLIGLLTPDAGEILIEGEPIHADGVLDRHRMAMVFQSGALLNSLTVGENVGLYLSEHRLRPPDAIARVVDEKLALVGLRDAADKMPGELSGGMKKRASIARALVSEPQLILYDEPTSELDPLMAVTVGEEILKLNRRMRVTSVVVTHDRDLAFGIADRIALMSDGQMVALGTPAEIRQTTHPLLQEFLSANFQFQPADRNEKHP
jgi:phospholipid/cholesterol/gamma-HCH transport system ATP-binding protein